MSEFEYSAMSVSSVSLSFTDLTLGYPGKSLLESTNISMLKRGCYGVTGQNGSGKTSLLKAMALAANRPATASAVSTASSCSKSVDDVLYVEQLTDGLIIDQSPTEWILSTDKIKSLRMELDKLEKIANSDGEGDIDEERYEELQQAIGSWNIDHERYKINGILKGFGFIDTHLPDLQRKPVKDYSGGWQMRVILAKALYCDCMITLFDEPSNHLDLEATLWLQSYLKKHTQKGRIVGVVSHNIGFLNAVCTHIVNISGRKLVVYAGSEGQAYTSFREQADQDYDKQVKDFDLYTKQLTQAKKSGKKQELEKFLKKRAVVEAPEKPYVVKMRFQNFEAKQRNLVVFNDVSFSYGQDSGAAAGTSAAKVLQNINFTLTNKDKFILAGINGSGKTTFLKLLTGELEPTTGDIVTSNCRFGVLNQHFQLPDDISAVDYLAEQCPNTISQGRDPRQVVRTYLGSIKLDPKAHLIPMGQLSGGQKVRIQLIKLTLSTPNAIILDEPTNHLDIETVEGLILALQEFEGAVVVITHETELMERLEHQFILLRDGQIDRSIKNFEEYAELFEQEDD